MPDKWQLAFIDPPLLAASNLHSLSLPLLEVILGFKSFIQDTQQGTHTHTHTHTHTCRVSFLRIFHLLLSGRRLVFLGGKGFSGCPLSPRVQNPNAFEVAISKAKVLHALILKQTPSLVYNCVWLLHTQSCIPQR